MRLREKCAVFAAYSKDDTTMVARSIFYGLLSQQHRGQEASGICTFDTEGLRIHRNLGLVREVYTEAVLQDLFGPVGIGHNRYSTTGATTVENCHPFLIKGTRNGISIAHNGNLVNAEELRDYLSKRGHIFTSSTDTELIAHILAIELIKNDFEVALVNTMKRIKGAYSLVILTGRGELAAVRDPKGFRPLCTGSSAEAYFVASESVGIEAAGGEFERSIEPGEILLMDQRGVKSIKPFRKQKRAHCMFEYVYFARPDSIINGKYVLQVREDIGKRLAIEHPVEADAVVPVPDSARTAAGGFSRESGIPAVEGIYKNRYIGRTFIMPKQSVREEAVRLKMNAVRPKINGKRVVLQDDSIVRGTTTRKIIEILRKGGATEVHVRIGCPPLRWPCFMGIDMATRKELIAARKDVEEVRKSLGADSL
ncbi:MAG: amidophosphoribosyltransferase, partial [Theionarchaea archaeon]|nr:amidophosphoribosyltransferase [Theionarchaea archaeon]